MLRTRTRNNLMTDKSYLSKRDKSVSSNQEAAMLEASATNKDEGGEGSCMTIWVIADQQHQLYGGCWPNLTLSICMVLSLPFRPSTRLGHQRPLSNAVLRGQSDRQQNGHGPRQGCQPRCVCVSGTARYMHRPPAMHLGPDSAPTGTPGCAPPHRRSRAHAPQQRNAGPRAKGAQPNGTQPYCQQ